MKKLRKILSLLLATMATFSIAGCQSNLTEEEKAQIAKIQEIKDSIGKLMPTLVNDFEQPKDFYVLQGADQSGVYVGKEMAYSGTKSAKVWIQPEDNPWSGSSAFIMPLDTGWRGDMSDISLVKSISFWVYNAQDEERTVTCKMELPSGASVKFSEEIENIADTIVGQKSSVGKTAQAVGAPVVNGMKNAVTQPAAALGKAAAQEAGSSIKNSKAGKAVRRAGSNLKTGAKNSVKKFFGIKD